MILELPYPPSINHYYKTVRINRSISIFIGEKGIAYRNKVFEAVRKHKNETNQLLHDPYFPHERLKVHIDLYPPDRRRRDLDNIFKGVLDSLQHGVVFKDDNQIDKLTIERKEIIKNGKLIIDISTL